MSTHTIPETHRRRTLFVTLRSILIVTLSVAVVVLIEAVWFAHPSVRRGDVKSIEKHLVDKLTGAVEDNHLGSAGLVLVQGGDIAVARGFGIGNVETQAPVDPERTLFQLASVSKAVTAWGVMNLVEDGAIGPDEPILRYLKRWRFPGSAEYRDRVTVRHLLSHTAGIDDGYSTRGYLPGEAVPSPEDALTLPRDPTSGDSAGVVVLREPGAAMSYSSSAGYMILQLLVEEVTNRSFTEYMRDSVLRPLGMSRSSYDLDELVAEGREQDVAPNFDNELTTQPRRRYAAKAAVSLYATPMDLARFVQAYTRENPVLTRESLLQMLSPQMGTGGTWGLGHALFVENDAGGRVVGHDGGSYPAWGAMVRVNPATGNGMVLTVSGASGGSVNQLAHDWVYWETGQITFEGRRQIVQNRVVPAFVLILLGTIIILIRTRLSPHRHTRST